VPIKKPEGAEDLLSHWWVKLARERLEEKRQKAGARKPGWRYLDSLVDHQQWPLVNDERIQRCLDGKNVVWDVALAVSEALEIEPPGFYVVFDGPEDASVFRRRLEAAETSPGVAELRDLTALLRAHLSQSAPVTSADDEQPGPATTPRGKQRHSQSRR